MTATPKERPPPGNLSGPGTAHRGNSGDESVNAAGLTEGGHHGGENSQVHGQSREGGRVHHSSEIGWSTTMSTFDTFAVDDADITSAAAEHPFRPAGVRA